MIYNLMHKNIIVLNMELDDETGIILSVGDINNALHIPIGVGYNNNIIDKKSLNQWLKGRSIPASRENIAEVLSAIGESDSLGLITKCYGLSLSDCYWICPEDKELNFDKINFFDNEFSKDMGELLFGNKLDGFSLMSPDNTSDGWLKKKWIIKEGKRYLVKGCSGVYRQEPFNEVIANILCEKLDIPYVKYSVQFIDKMPYSICENFLSSDKELISAWSVYSHFKKANHISAYEHLISCYENIGISDARTQLEKMLILDYLLANTDRHMNNFGIVRDSTTLKTISIAPIYDSGTSMLMSTPKLLSNNIESKPFAKTHIEQIKLISGLGSVNKSAIMSSSKEILEVLKSNPYLDEDRISFVMEQFEGRCKALFSLF